MTLKPRYCLICGTLVPEERVIRLDAVTCNDECRAKLARLLGWQMEKAFG